MVTNILVVISAVEIMILRQENQEGNTVFCFFRTDRASIFNNKLSRLAQSSTCLPGGDMVGGGPPAFTDFFRANIIEKVRGICLNGK